MTDETQPEDAKNAVIIGPNQVIESSRKLDAHLGRSISDLRRGSLSVKVTSLVEDMGDFHRETHAVVDAVKARMAQAREKRDQAAAVYHQHYGGMIRDFQETIDAVEQLSNLPLDGNGGES